MNESNRLILFERNKKFQDLVISDEYFHELSRKPVNTLSTYELACFRVTERSNTMKKDLEATRIDLSDTKRSLHQALTTIQMQEYEISKSRRKCVYVCTSPSKYYNSRQYKTIAFSCNRC